MAHLFDNKKIFPIALLVLGMLLTFSAYGQTPAETITFPIAELGNCGNKDECRAYCNVAENIPACTAFAESRGLMNKDEAAQAKKMSQALTSGRGPGGCASWDACRAFCQSIANIEACASFAKANGVKTEDVKTIEKIGAYVKAGGAMPGNCTSKESCEVYCSDFSHSEECYAFAKKAGLQTDLDRRGEDSEKFAAFMQKGETPGSCRSKTECEAYCHIPEHRNECIDFGVKAGLIKPEEAEKIKQIGIGGPGGCNSHEACKAYCADPAHREECFRFAEEHGFLKEEETRELREGWASMRQGIENSPPEVRACVTTTLGENVIRDIEAGKIVPGPEIANRLRGCFERFGRKHDPNEVFKKAPANVLRCIKEKTGEDFADLAAGKIVPTPEIADAVRVCHFEASAFAPEQRASKHDPARFEGFLRNAPEEIRMCLRTNYNADYEKVMGGEDPGEAGRENVQKCFKEYRPPQIPGQIFPPRVAECIKAKVGYEAFERFHTARPSPEQTEIMKQCYGIQNAPGNAPGNFPGNMPHNAPGNAPHNFPENMPGNAPHNLWGNIDVLRCVKDLYGEEMAAKVQQAGFKAEPVMEQRIGACLAAKHNIAPQTIDFAGQCVRELYGEELARKIDGREFTPGAEMERSIRACVEAKLKPAPPIPQSAPVPGTEGAPPENPPPPPPAGDEPPQSPASATPPPPPSDINLVPPPPPPPPPEEPPMPMGTRVRSLLGKIDDAFWGVIDFVTR